MCPIKEKLVSVKQINISSRSILPKLPTSFQKMLKIFSDRYEKWCYERVWTRRTLRPKSSPRQRQLLLPRLSRLAQATRPKRSSTTMATFLVPKISPMPPPMCRPLQLSLNMSSYRRRFRDCRGIGHGNTHQLLKEVPEGKTLVLHTREWCKSYASYSCKDKFDDNQYCTATAVFSFKINAHQVL